MTLDPVEQGTGEWKTSEEPIENLAAKRSSGSLGTVLSLIQVAHVLGLEESVGQDIDEKQLPKCRAGGKCSITICPTETNTTSGNNSVESSIFSMSRTLAEALPDGEEELEEAQEAEYTAERPYLARVAGGRWLTAKNDLEEATQDGPKWGETKRVLHMDISLGDSGIEYHPGDSIGIICPNPAHLVTAILNRLSAAVSSSKGGVPLTPATLVTLGDGRKRTIAEVLSYRYDLVGVPKKNSVLKLASYCSDPAEARQIKHLCSKGPVGKALWEQFIEAQRVGMGELILLFPSCSPPSLQELLSCLTPMPARYYSIASSPLKTPNQLSIAFSVVRYTCGINPAFGKKTTTTTSTTTTNNNNNSYNKMDTAATGAKSGNVVVLPIKRQGLCTSYLERILAPWLSTPSACSSPSSEGDTATDAVVIPHHASPGPRIRIFLKPTVYFRLPGKVSSPLILIGPGTGVSPFIGFLEHREMIEKQRQAKLHAEDMSTGIWRGAFEMEEKDLPCECNYVGDFIHSVLPGAVRLYFGCRNEDDFLYQDKLRAYEREGTLTKLDVAMSRPRRSSRAPTVPLQQDEKKEECEEEVKNVEETATVGVEAVQSSSHAARDCGVADIHAKNNSNSNNYYYYYSNNNNVSNNSTNDINSSTSFDSSSICINDSDGSSTQKKVYVTQKLLSSGEEVAKLILKEGAYVFICGDGNQMAKDVHAALREIIATHGGMEEEEAEDKLDDMKLRRRYVLDIWS